MLSLPLRDLLTLLLLIAVVLLTAELSFLPGDRSHYIEDDDSPFLSISFSDDTERPNTYLSDDAAPMPRNHEVKFLDYKSMMTANHTNDAYSGMWWARRDLFESKWRRPYWEMAVKASFAFFDRVGRKNVLLTKDWMDFNVEHLSHYFKYMTMTESAFARHVEKQVHYQREQSSPPQSNAKRGFPNTLAIMPYYRGKNDKHEEYPSLEEVPEKQRKKYLYMLSITSTLVSLHRVGIPRVIITGNTMEEPPEVHQAIELAQGHTGTAFEVSYIPIFGQDMFDLHTPTKALDQLQAALNNTMPSDKRQQWLGDSPDAIEYIYFSEPDLILHARHHDQLVAAMDQGKIMAAHRFQILPHEIDFPNKEHPKELLPNMKTLSEFVDLDTETDSCCDAGNYWPGLDEHKLCHVGGDVWWYRCGHLTAKDKMTNDEFYEQHFRLNGYPVIRLTNGIHAPVVQEHSRLCRPAKAGECQ